MTRERIRGGIGLMLLAAVIILTAVLVRSPRVTPEANMRYASDASEAQDSDMAELLMLLNGE